MSRAFLLALFPFVLVAPANSAARAHGNSFFMALVGTSLVALSSGAAVNVVDKVCFV